MKFLCVLVILGLGNAVPVKRQNPYVRPTGPHCVAQQVVDSQARAPAQNPNPLPNHAGCGESKYDKRNLDADKRVVGGNKTREGRWPWVAAMLQIQGDSAFQFCGGAIIDSRWVLTAAHCFDEVDPDNNALLSRDEWRYRGLDPCSYAIHTGQNELFNWTNDLQLVGVDQIIIHEGYTFHGWGVPQAPVDHDIALLKLHVPVDLGYDDSNVLCIPTENQNYDEDVCAVAGWGRTQEGGQSSQMMLHTNIPHIDQTDCEQFYPHQMSDTTICAGHVDGGTGSCQGDSGGPLMCLDGDHWTHIGVVSWGAGCARRNKPTIFTDVRAHRDWIQDVMTRYSSDDYNVVAPEEKPADNNNNNNNNNDNHNNNDNNNDNNNNDNNNVVYYYYYF